MADRPETFFEVPFSAADLKGVPKSFRGAFIASNLAASSICFYWRLHLMTIYDTDGMHEIARNIASVHSLILTRLLSSLIVEQIETTREFLKDPEIDDKDIIIAKIIDLKRIITNNSEYQVATRIRNKTTNHLDAGHLSDFVDAFDGDHNFSIFAHSIGGNSVFPFAEEIALHGEFQHQRSSKTNFSKWSDWVLKSSKICFDITNSINQKILLDYMPNVNARSRRSVFPSDMFFESGAKLPFIWQEKIVAKPTPT